MTGSAEQKRELSALIHVRERLAELGVDSEVYRIGIVVDDMWCMVREGQGWTVFWASPGNPQQKADFATAEQAAAYLLGAILIVPARMHPGGVASTPIHASLLGETAAMPVQRGTRHRPADPSESGGGQSAFLDQSTMAMPAITDDSQPLPLPPGTPVASATPIEALPGEPPLTLYADLREGVLPAGLEIDRFGDPDGNVAYRVGTHYDERSLPLEWRNRGYHVYRVTRPLRALTGTAIPWFDQPGGGTAHVLPASIQSLLADGALTEVR